MTGQQIEAEKRECAPSSAANSNVQLHSSAHELLSALSKIEAALDFDDVDGAWTIAHEAIAKARGTEVHTR